MWQLCSFLVKLFIYFFSFFFVFSFLQCTRRTIGNTQLNPPKLNNKCPKLRLTFRLYLYLLANWSYNILSLNMSTNCHPVRVNVKGTINRIFSCFCLFIFYFLSLSRIFIQMSEWPGQFLCYAREPEHIT